MNRPRFDFFSILLACSTMHLLVATSFGQDPTPAGGEFQVNTYSTNQQFIPKVARDSQGNFVVVWGSFGSDNGDDSTSSVQGQLFSSAGSPVNPQFLVNTYTSHEQLGHQVAMAPNGDFVVVWQSRGSNNGDTSGRSVQGQRFSSGGTPQGVEFLVNTYTTSYQDVPSVAVDSAGGFIVVWESEGSDETDTDQDSIQAQRFFSDGSVQGTQFQVNTYTYNWQKKPSVAVAVNGDFTVAWSSYGSSYGDTSYSSIQAQRFVSDGSPIGGQFQVNTYTDGPQSYPNMAADPSGGFVIAWQGTDEFYAYHVFAQLYSSDGSPVGGELHVSPHESEPHSNPSVSTDKTGAFVVVWNGPGYGDTPFSGVLGRRYSPSGEPIGNTFLVNTNTAYDQRLASVAVKPGGDFIVVWQDDDFDRLDIFGQRFFGLFGDGFESGGLGKWTSAHPKGQPE